VNDPHPENGKQALISPEENRRMFDTISRRYDLLNRIISLGRDHAWRRKAVDHLQVKRDGQYIDAGCGTGALSLEIAGRFQPGAVTVTGVDFSEAMLREGEKRLQRLGAQASVTLRRGDALALPFGDATADGVISGFVLRNISDRPGALAEWFRVLRPGGRCLVLELAVPEKPIARWMYSTITRLLVPAAAFLLSRHKAYVYLLDSIRAFPPPEAVLAMFRSAGYTEVQSIPLTFGAVRIYCGTKP
jgi:demethylmenaquinone methyltransferase / 2-methoxy-6-polyprenyl-1,4-benzoquinol methylase